MLYGFSLAITKKVSRTSMIDLQIVYNAMCLIFIGPFVHVSIWEERSLITYILIGATALFNLAMNWIYIQSYRAGDVTVFSTLESFSIPIGALIGFLVWKEIPETHEISEACFIIIGGILAIRNRKELSILS